MKAIIGKDEKCCEKVENTLPYLSKEQVEKYTKDLVYGKHDFNRYGIVISFLSIFLTEVTDTDEMS